MLHKREREVQKNPQGQTSAHSETHALGQDRPNKWVQMSSKQTK